MIFINKNMINAKATKADRTAKLTATILELEKKLSKLKNLHASFDYLRINIASPKRIQNWSQRILPNGEVVGEVLKPETINFRTHQPEMYGLFCERIFGPIKNWKCKCGKYNGFAIDKICDECKVEITEARVRRYRMGYIELTCPVTHLWYFKGIPNYLLTLLRCLDEALTLPDLEEIIYLRSGSALIGEYNPLKTFAFYDKRGVTDNSELKTFYADSLIGKRRGSEILKAALESIDLDKYICLERSFVQSFMGSNLNEPVMLDKTLVRRIRILESFLASKINPGWMILTTLPILPPNLRPLLELENGRLVAADVNEIYRLVITRNQRLFDFLYTYVCPDLLSIQGRKLLQDAVDSLIDNSRLPKNKTFCLNNKPLKSLTETLEGKQGRFRQSLLGKRVDYSGRSVIVVGPTLRLNECGLPYEMAIELFQPHLINALLQTKIQPPSHNTKLAQIMIKKNKPFVWTLLKKLTRKYSILLNRAPTLHRFGIQAFDPVIVLGQAIHLHPLVCTGFNADFDGDQMAVHLPLYESSQLEVRTMMRPSYNLISPSNGEVIVKPTQDMVIGCYYLTSMIAKNNQLIQTWFANENDALNAFYQKKINLHTPILVRYSLLNFDITIEKDSIIFLENSTFFKSTEKEIFLYKIFQLQNNIKKYYLITNIGILIAYPADENKFILTDLFLETTAGRLIFSINFKNSMRK